MFYAVNVLSVTVAIAAIIYFYTKHIGLTRTNEQEFKTLLILNCGESDSMFSAVTGHVHVKASIDIGCGKTPGSTNFDVKSDWGMDRLSPQQVIIRVAGLQHDFFPDPQKINSFHCHAENLCFFDEIMWPHAMMHLLVDISLHFRPAQVMVSERLQMARFFTKEIADSARVDILEYLSLIHI